MASNAEQTATSPTSIPTYESTSHASSSSTLVEWQPPPGPLPLKSGEIGFREEQHGRTEGNGATDANTLALPARHPADRDGAMPSSSDNNNTHTADATQPAAPMDTASTHSKRSIISFFTPKEIPTYGGIRLTTFLTIAAIILFMGGTITAWEMTVRRLSLYQKMQSPDGTSMTSAVVFIHVLFAVVVLALVVLLERWVFRLRAERYAHLHPGEMLPSSRHFSSHDTTVGFAPWNRPPLPTYAAALIASGHGTGDVEDNIIAAPPPPAYGNTRGSRLILAGFLRDSLRAQRPRSEQSLEGQTDDRPKSYASHDEEWEEIRDAERATNLEETLARLEEGSSPDHGHV